MLEQGGNVMTEATIICPKCNAEIKLTESLTDGNRSKRLK